MWIADRRRHWTSLRIAAGLAGTLLGATLSFATWQVLPAAAAPMSAPAIAPLTPAQDAARSVGAFRISMRAQLNDYVKKYGPRLSAAERERLSRLTAESDARLARLSTLANATATWDRRGNRTRALRSANDAVVAFDSSYARANAVIEEVKPILQPHLNFFEALDAQVALDARMAEFRQIGDQLRRVQAGIRDRNA